jgi:hypothetical protein
MNEPTNEQIASVRAWTTWARAVAMDETRPSIDMTYEEAEATDELLRALVDKHLTGEARAMANKWINSRMALWFLMADNSLVKFPGEEGKP